MTVQQRLAISLTDIHARLRASAGVIDAPINRRRFPSIRWSEPRAQHRAIIDIDSSGLGPDSWPVSIAWHILETGMEGHLLIKPAAGWTAWQAEAEEIHGLDRPFLERHGVPVGDAAWEIAHALQGV